jgi:hypothetical protein
MAGHDPLTFATQLSAKLATRSRHVCAFLGAGIARACGLPDVSQLQERVGPRLVEKDRAVFASLLHGRNIEGALSRLRRIAALVTGEDRIDQLSAGEARALDASICEAIVAELDVAAANLSPVTNLAAWAARADYRVPVELFTVNYDLLLETALERLRVPYFDGFVGQLKARFFTELVETEPSSGLEGMPRFFIRLWKLHGSVNWAWENESQIVRLGQPVNKGLAAAIYPSDTKYEDSKRVPFIVLQDRFRRALNQPETLTLITGYSFHDDHLNEMIFDAATRRERSEFVAFSYDAIPDFLADRASSTPNLQVVSANEAIIGGTRAEWAPHDDSPKVVWDHGEFLLRDFARLSAYLAKSARVEADANE